MFHGKTAPAVTRTDKLPGWFYPAWASATVSVSIFTALLGYFTFYATNFLGLAPGTVGLMLMLSKLFDGMTDLMAGFLIDRTNTRLGRARPYQLAIVFYGALVVLLFSAPEMGKGAAIIFCFVVYTLIFSVFGTLLSCSDAVYMARSVPSDAARVKLLSFTGVLSIVMGAIVAALMPQLVSTLGATRQGWTTLAMVLSVLSVVIGLIRFFSIKETAQITPEASRKVGLREGARFLFTNRYILIFALAMLLANLATNLNQVAPYYFTYIIGDLSKMSLVSLGVLAAPVVLVAGPLLAQKIGMIRMIRIALAVGTVGYLLPLLAPRTLPLLVGASVLQNAGYFPIMIYCGSVIINCMDYSEWKYGKRVEGIYASTIGFCSKVGIGVAAGLIGGVMALGGFDGTAAVQAPGAERSILLLYTALPAGLLFASFIALSFFGLYKKLPQIQSELAARRTGKGEAGNE